MKRELPEYIFEKKFDNFYLLSEYDIIFNEQFTHRFNIFLENTGFENLMIKLDIDSNDGNRFIKVLNIYELNELYDREISIDENKIPLFMMNFFITDDLKKWEIYISLENELSIIGCKKEVSSLLELIINPYEEESFEQRCQIIDDMFLNDLKRNYDFF